jgi:hypothetical protein
MLRWTKPCQVGKLCPLSLLIILPVFVGCSASDKNLPLESYLSKAEAKIAMDNFSPENGCVIPNLKWLSLAKLKVTKLFVENGRTFCIAKK